MLDFDFDDVPEPTHNSSHFSAINLGGDENPYSDLGMMDMGGIDAEDLNPISHLSSIASTVSLSSLMDGNGMGSNDFGFKNDGPMGASTANFTFVGRESFLAIDKRMTIASCLCAIALILMLFAVMLMYIVAVILIFMINHDIHNLHLNFRDVW